MNIVMAIAAYVREREITSIITTQSSTGASFEYGEMYTAARTADP